MFGDNEKPPLRQAKFPGEKEPLLDNAVVERLSALVFTKRNHINM